MKYRSMISHVAYYAVFAGFLTVLLLIGYQSLQMMKRPLFSPLYVDSAFNTNPQFIAARKNKAKMNRSLRKYGAMNDRFIRHRNRGESYPSLATRAKKAEDRRDVFDHENEEVDLDDNEFASTEDFKGASGEEGAMIRHHEASIDPTYHLEGNVSGYQQPISPFMNSQMNYAMPTAQMIPQMPMTAPPMPQAAMYPAMIQMQAQTAVMQAQAVAMQMQAQAAALMMERQQGAPYAYTNPSYGYQGYSMPQQLPVKQSLSQPIPFSGPGETDKNNKRRLAQLLAHLSSQASEIQPLIHLIDLELAIIAHLAAGHRGHMVQRAVRERNRAFHQSTPLVDEIFELIVNEAASIAKRTKIPSHNSVSRKGNKSPPVFSKRKEEKAYLHSMVKALEQYYREIQKMQHSSRSLS